jgi:UPF0755 protein
VWIPLGKPKELHRAVVIGSMIELEVMRDDERPVVAGVVENRLKIGMRLQLDATVLYAMQRWKNPTRRDLVETRSPYNTYLVAGLPPGPICSPTVKSVRAALQPKAHDYLYYVALPTGQHMFAATYPEHLRNIRRRKAAIAAMEKP